MVMCMGCVVFVYTSMCLCNCQGINHQSHATSICFLDNLKRSGETAHGDVGGLTACHVEVGTANFAWRFSQKRIREVLSNFILACTSNMQRESQSQKIDIENTLIRFINKIPPMVLTVPDVPGAVCRLTISI